MEIIKSTNGPAPVLRLSGRFDAHEIEPVNAWFQEQLGKGNIKMVVNLEGVNFVDSTGLSTLVRGLKNSREKGGDVHVCCLQQPVRVIFELTRLDKAFNIFQSEAEASKAFS